MKPPNRYVSSSRDDDGIHDHHIVSPYQARGRNNELRASIPDILKYCRFSGLIQQGWDDGSTFNLERDFLSTKNAHGWFEDDFVPSYWKFLKDAKNDFEDYNESALDSMKRAIPSVPATEADMSQILKQRIKKIILTMWDAIPGYSFFVVFCFLVLWEFAISNEYILKYSCVDYRHDQ